jgi:hypothetical protein
VLALEATASPSLRPHELRRDCEQFVGGGGVHGVRPTGRGVVGAVAWRGRRPLRKPVGLDRHRSARYVGAWEADPLAEASPLIRDCRDIVAHESDHLIVVSDRRGSGAPGRGRREGPLARGRLDEPHMAGVSRIYSPRAIAGAATPAAPSPPAPRHRRVAIRLTGRALHAGEPTRHATRSTVLTHSPRGCATSHA